MSIDHNAKLTPEQIMDAAIKQSWRVLRMPLCYLTELTGFGGGYAQTTFGDKNGFPVWTLPPEKDWVGLTVKEIFKLYMDSECADIEDCLQFEKIARAIEAKLKEKNAYGWQSVANPTEWLDDLRGSADICGND